MTLLVAIDQSTSATKALLVDADGSVVGLESEDHRQIYPKPGWVEHDAEEITANMRRAVERLVGRHPDRLDEIVGVSITNQRETFVAFDRESGAPLGPAIVWQCRRGDAICEELRAGGAEGRVTEKTGLRLDSYFSGPKMAWLVRQRPDLAARLRDGAACLSTVDAYLVHRLTGGETFATDPTNASRTLLFDIGRLEWDDELCRLFGVPQTALPEVRDSTGRFGQTDVHGLLPRPVPIVGVMGDSQASLFAQCCYAPGEAKVTLGTGASVLVNIGPEFRPPPDGAVAALAWVVDGLPTYAWEGLVNYAAATLAWLKDQLGLVASVSEVEPLAASVPNSEGVYLVPAFSGMGAPHWRPEARAAIVGMTGRTRREHVVRAALESIALQVGDVLDMLSTQQHRPKALCVDGGPTANELLMRLLADVTGRELVASDETNLSALGAAMAGMLGLGVVGSQEELRSRRRATRRYEPATDRDAVTTLRAGWRQAVARVL